MLYKGIIIEIKDDYSIVMTDESEFLRIKNKDGMEVGQKIYFLEEDIYSQKIVATPVIDDLEVEEIEENNQNKRVKIIDFNERKASNKNNKHTMYKRFISMAAAIAIIVTTVIYTTAPKSYATVSFDENGSSIELDLDKEKRINSSSVINGSIDISDDKDFETVLEQLYKQIKRDSKNNKNGRVLVALCFNDNVDSEYEKEIKALISKNFKGLNIMYIRVDKNQVEQNKNAEISMGEYAAMKMIEEDDIEGMTIERLEKMLKDGKYAYLREEILDELEDRTEEQYDDDDDDIDDIEDYYKNSNRKNKNNKADILDDDDDRKSSNSKDDDDDKESNSYNDSNNDNENSGSNNVDDNNDSNDDNSDSDDNNEEDDD